jgi:hypothetical protein
MCTVQELGRTDLQQVAKDRLLALIRTQPQNERALFNLAMITMDEVGNISSRSGYRHRYGSGSGSRYGSRVLKTKNCIKKNTTEIFFFSFL